MKGEIAQSKINEPLKSAPHRTFTTDGHIHSRHKQDWSNIRKSIVPPEDRKSHILEEARERVRKFSFVVPISGLNISGRYLRYDSIPMKYPALDSARTPTILGIYDRYLESKRGVAKKISRA